MILTVLKLHSPKGSCNFENCQNHSYLLIKNCTRGRAIFNTNFTGLISRTLKLRAKILNPKGQNSKEAENFANKVLALFLPEIN